MAVVEVGRPVDRDPDEGAGCLARAPRVSGRARRKRRSRQKKPSNLVPSQSLTSTLGAAARRPASRIRVSGSPPGRATRRRIVVSDDTDVLRSSQ